MKNDSVKNVLFSAKRLTDSETLSSLAKLNDEEKLGAVIALWVQMAYSVVLQKKWLNHHYALQCFSDKLPNVPVAFSSILSRRGKSDHVKKFNDDASDVNDKIFEIWKASE